jgi:suppressor of fused-like protein
MTVQHTSAPPDTSDHAAAPASGADALAASLGALYKGRKPRQYDNPNPRRRGGQDPLDSVCVWQRAEPLPHWHYVSMGFSELHAKASPNKAVSGFGFELSFRLACAPGAGEPPLWPMLLMQSLARYVYQSGNAFHHGHRLSINGPLSLGNPTHLCALGFAFDPEMPAIETPNGHVAFLQMIGLTVDEERAAQQWETGKLLALLQPHMPLGITDLQRGSLLTLAEVLAPVNEGIRRDGSSCVAVYTDLLAVRHSKPFLRKAVAEITLGARQITQLAELLPLRLPFGRPFVLAGPNWKLQFELARRNSWCIEEGVLKLFVAAASVQEFATLLHPRLGVYKLPAFQQLLWNVQQTLIRNASGDVVDIIG